MVLVLNMMGLALALLSGQPAKPPVAAPAPEIAEPIDPIALARWYRSGQCVARDHRRTGAQVLASLPESESFFMLALRIPSATGCFPDVGGPGLHGNAMRGAIVEAMLLLDFRGIGLARGARTAPVADLASLPPPDQQAGPQRVGMAYLRLAECMVELAPEGSFAVFATPVASPAETAAIQGLVPAIEQCLPPDLQLTLRPPVIRSYLAEAAYRVSVRRLAVTRP